MKKSIDIHTLLHVESLPAECHRGVELGFPPIASPAFHQRTRIDAGCMSPNLVFRLRGISISQAEKHGPTKITVEQLHVEIGNLGVAVPHMYIHIQGRHPIGGNVDGLDRQVP